MPKYLVTVKKTTVTTYEQTEIDAETSDEARETVISMVQDDDDLDEDQVEEAYDATIEAVG